MKFKKILKHFALKPRARKTIKKVIAHEKKQNEKQNVNS